MEQTLHEKLIYIQQHLNVPKTLKNTFGGYLYRSAELIIDAAKPFLEELSLSLTFTDDVMCVGGKNYIKSTAILSDGISFIEKNGLAQEPNEQKGMSASQLTGNASSYARKYALNGLFAIDDGKDADSTKPSKEKPLEVITVAQMQSLKPLIDKIAGIETVAGSEDIKKELAKDTEGLPEAQKNFLRNAFSNKVKELKK